MSIDYAGIIPGIVSAIQGAGIAITVRRIVEGAAPDPTKPWIVNAHDPLKDLTFDAFMIWDYQTRFIRQGQSNSNVSRIAYMAPFASTLKRGDRCEGKIGTSMYGESWGVQDIVNIDPGGVILLWEAQLEKWPLARMMQVTP